MASLFAPGELAQAQQEMGVGGSKLMQPTGSQPAGSSGTETIGQMAARLNTTTPVQPPTPPAQPGLLSRIGTDLSGRANDISSNISNVQNSNPATSQGLKSNVVAGANIAGAIGGGIGDIGSELVKSLISVLPQTTVDPTNTKPIDYSKILSTPAVQAASQKLSALAAQHPNIASVLKDVANGLSGATTLEGAGALKDMVGNAASSALEKAPSILNSAAENVGNVASGIKGTANEMIGRTTGKSLEDILATPEKDVTKLNPTDQKTWNDANKAKIAAPFDQKEQALKMAEDARQNVHTQGLADMNKNLASATRDEVIANRPKGLQMMSDASQQFRSIFNEEVAGKTGIKVDQNGVGKFIDNQFGDNPVQAAQLKAKLGIPQVIDPNAPKTETTLGQILSKMKDLKQEVGTAAKTGARTFSPDEKLTTDAAGTLSEYLKTQGVDLSRSNKFWSEYKPIQKQYVSLAKPFNSVGTETKGMANVLKNVALGKDVNNENFIAHIERMQGEPINVNGKSIVANMSAAEKEDAAARIQHEVALAKNSADKEAALKSLESDAHARLRTAKIKEAVKKVVGVVVADKLAKHVIGVGF